LEARAADPPNPPPGTESLPGKLGNSFISMFFVSIRLLKYIHTACDYHLFPEIGQCMW
jgi:hypothetical protein